MSEKRARISGTYTIEVTRELRVNPPMHWLRCLPSPMVPKRSLIGVCRYRQRAGTNELVKPTAQLSFGMTAPVVRPQFFRPVKTER
jgi:hypothetical protein